MRKQIINILKVNTECTTKISESSLLSDLGISSLDFVKIIVEIETEFGFEFEDGKLSLLEFPTVQSLIDYAKEKVGK